LEFSFENTRKKSLYEATELIIAAVIPIAKRNAYVQYFLDIVLERDIKTKLEYLIFFRIGIKMEKN